MDINRTLSVQQRRIGFRAISLILTVVIVGLLVSEPWQAEPDSMNWIRETRPMIHVLPKAAGIAGFLIYVSVFAAVQVGVMNGNCISYTLWNILAAVLVLVSLQVDFNLASALIQGSWILIGLGGLMLRLKCNGRRRRASACVPTVDNSIR